MGSIYSVKNPQRQPTTPTKQDDDASTMRYTIQVDNAVAAGESHSAFGISSTTSTMCDFHNFGLIFTGQCTVCLKG